MNGAPSSQSLPPYETALPPEGKGRDLVLAGLTFSGVFLFLNSLFFSPGFGLGEALSLSLLFWAMTGYFGPKRPLKSRLLLYGGLQLLLCGGILLSCDEPSQLAAIALIFILYFFALPLFSRSHAHSEGSWRLLEEGICSFFVQGMGNLYWGWSALMRKKDPEGRVANRKLGRILAGVLLALPLLVIVIPLLIHSDAAFEGLITQLSPDSLGELFVSLLLCIFLFFPLFTQAFCRFHTEAPQKPAAKQGKADSVMLCSFLIAVGAVYLLYLFTQTAYFFNAFSGLLPENYSLSQYARRGFFELCAICAINLLTVLISLRICRPKEGKLPLPVKIALAFVAVFSLFLIGTAMAKMTLYMQSLGLTRLRIYTSLFMVFLAFVFVFLLIRLFRPAFPYFPLVLVIACILTAGMAFVNTDRLIADYNVNAYLEGRHEALDLSTVSRLRREASAPALLRLYRESPDPEERESARRALTQTLKQHFTVSEDGSSLQPKPLDLRRWNLAQSSCRSFLCEHWQEFYEPN